MEAQQAKGFESWAIIELFGHNKIAGLVTEQTFGGSSLLRVDVPEVDADHPAFTKFFGIGAIYGMTPTTETNARAAAAQMRVRPFTLYILPEPPRQLARVMSDEDIEGYAHADAMEDDRFDDDDYEPDDDDPDDDDDTSDAPSDKDIPF